MKHFSHTLNLLYLSIKTVSTRIFFLGRNNSGGSPTVPSNPLQRANGKQGDSSLLPRPSSRALPPSSTPVPKPTAVLGSTFF